MADLFGGEYADLWVQKDGEITASASARKLLSLTEGAVYIWSSELIEFAFRENGGDKDLIAKTHWVAEELSNRKNTRARETEPVSEMAELLLDKSLLSDPLFSPYRFTTRSRIIDKLIEQGALTGGPKDASTRVQYSRIQYELLEAGLIDEMVPAKGSRPGIFIIKYPFEIQSEQAPSRLPKNRSDVIDLVSIKKMTPLTEQEKDQQIIEMKRQVTSKGRPHESIDEDKNPIKEYKSKTVIFSPSGKRGVLELTSATYNDSPEGVMSKTDEQIWRFTLRWCVREMRSRYQSTTPSDDWYFLTPEELAETINATRYTLDNVRSMMIRWADTRLTASFVEEIAQPTPTGEDEDEFISNVQKEPITQFSEYKIFTRRTRKGREILHGIRFRLPRDLQADIERKARGEDDENERKIEGLAMVITSNSGRSIMSDPFAASLYDFFWSWARRWRKHKDGWQRELWEGFQEMFDFDFGHHLPLTGDKRRNELNKRRKRFYRYFMKFLEMFSPTPEEHFNLLKGSTDAGLIELTLDFCKIRIELESRSISSHQRTGKVSIVPVTGKNRINFNGDETTISPQALEDFFITVEDLSLKKGEVREILEKYGKNMERVKAAFDVYRHHPGRKTGEFFSKGDKHHIDSGLQYISTLLNNPKNTTDSLHTDIQSKSDWRESLSKLGDRSPKTNGSREGRKAVTAAVMDIQNTDW